MVSICSLAITPVFLLTKSQAIIILSSKILIVNFETTKIAQMPHLHYYVYKVSITNSSVGRFTVSAYFTLKKFRT